MLFQPLSNRTCASYVPHAARGIDSKIDAGRSRQKIQLIEGSLGEIRNFYGRFSNKKPLPLPGLDYFTGIRLSPISDLSGSPEAYSTLS